MLQKTLSSTSFFIGLLHLDIIIAEEWQTKSCRYCGSKLHVANFQRKPRGHSCRVPADFTTRFSFCCSECRKRETPPSVRFLGRKIYLGAAILLTSALLGRKLPAKKLARLRAVVGADRRTLMKWKEWWATDFSTSEFWKITYARFAVTFNPTASIPFNLLKLYQRTSRAIGDSVEKVLTLLLPLTSGGGPERARYFMVA